MDKIQTITVIGAGFMGSGIAQVAAESGFKTCINDIVEEQVCASIQKIYAAWDKKAAKHRITEEECAAYKNNLSGSAKLEEALCDCDLVIEAAVENIEIKKQIFANIEAIKGDDVIIASNTSSLPISELAAASANAEKFIGMHFFSPVPSMKLLEIIPGLATSPEILQTAKDIGEKLGKVCIVSKDSSGFIVNRLLDPMMNQAVVMLDEGVGSVEDIDAGMKFGCNHPMGPLEILDMVGIEVELAVMNVLHAQLGDAFRPSTLMTRMVQAGYLGKKTGKGFYIYHEDGTKTSNPMFNR